MIAQPVRQPMECTLYLMDNATGKIALRANRVRAATVERQDDTEAWDGLRLTVGPSKYTISFDILNDGSLDQTLIKEFAEVGYGLG